ncbi:MAG: DapH/DapD/GlmU-related protein [Candidatus Aminicenantales bacterium]
MGKIASRGKKTTKTLIKTKPKTKKPAKRAAAAKRPPASPPPSFFIHPTAIVDPGVKIGSGTKIWHFSHVQTGAKIGKNCILGQNVNVGNNVVIGDFVKIQNNVSVYEGVTLEDYVFCGPSMVFTNVPVPRGKYPQVGAAFYKPTVVKEGASFGANSTIVCGHTIGRFAFVGAGAVVTKDVPDYALVVGNPARIVGWLSEAGEKLKFDAEGSAVCPRCGRRYRLENGGVRDVTDEGGAR